uniref:ADAMTS/ADAMTS-like Spacer 1 domain-containing protein n=1 Tax=Astyanax mexicanus TaxID=7994 RepID=A0A3B1J9V8_ASTMX
MPVRLLERERERERERMSESLQKNTQKHQRDNDKTPYTLSLSPLSLSLSLFSLSVLSVLSRSLSLSVLSLCSLSLSLLMFGGFSLLMALQQQAVWSFSFRRIQTLIQIFLLLSLLSPPSQPLPQHSDSSTTPTQECDEHQQDVCGVCSGDGTSCDLRNGTVSRSLLSSGYHKLLELPVRAQRIRIQELGKTRNYLALRTSSGEPVINGAWVIDRPGRFHAAGTVLTYKRPNEIRSRAGESITAPGPTNQELHLYVIYQQPNITVYYEYILPKEKPHQHPPRNS